MIAGARPSAAPIKPSLGSGALSRLLTSLGKRFLLGLAASKAIVTLAIGGMATVSRTATWIVFPAIRPPGNDDHAGEWDASSSRGVHRDFDALADFDQTDVAVLHPSTRTPRRPRAARARSAGFMISDRHALSSVSRPSVTTGPFVAPLAASFASFAFADASTIPVLSSALSRSVGTRKRAALFGDRQSQVEALAHRDRIAPPMGAMFSPSIAINSPCRKSVSIVKIVTAVDDPETHAIICLNSDCVGINKRPPTEVSSRPGT
jgi:hypothetical protein